MAPDAIHTVLFDAAGTLIETRESVGETYSRMARRFGVALPAWRLADAFRRILAQAPPLVFPGAALDEVEALERDWWRALVRSTFLAADSSVRFAEFDAFFDALYRAYSQAGAWRCRPGCLSTLRALRERGLETGVVSNFDRRLPEILTGLGLAPLLDTVVLPSDAGAAKPDPRIFRLALTRLAVAASGCVFVGDSRERDIAGARALGMRAVDVKSLATLCDLPECLAELQTSDPEPRDE